MNFLHGAMVLTLAGVMVKIIGSVNRILLSRMLGGEGIGLYQMAYPVYLLVTAVASAGIPIAVSIMVGERYSQIGDGCWWLFRRTIFWLLLGSGALLALLVAFGAGYLVDTGLISDRRAYYGILAVTPAIFLSMLLGGIRGYYQGFQLMLPTAVSQITEQFFRVVSMLALAWFLLPYGLEFAAAGAAGAAGVGALFGIGVLFAFDRPVLSVAGRRKSGGSVPGIIRRFVELVIPVSLSNLVIPLTAVLDMFLVPHCLLDSGYTLVEATTTFGYLAGMAQPLVLLAAIPVTAVVFSMVPALTKYPGERDKIAQQALRIVLLITLPAAMGMSALGGPLSELLYAAPFATEALVHTGPGIFFLGMLQVSAGILQGSGKVNWPLCTLGIGVLVKVVILIFYAHDIVLCAWATNISYALTALLNLALLYAFGYRFQILQGAKIVVASVLMGICVLYCHNMLYPCLGYNLTTVILLAGAVLLYGGMVLAFGVVGIRDLRALRIWHGCTGEKGRNNGQE